MESGSRCGFLPGQSAKTLPARYHRPRISLRSDQRRDPAEQPPLAAVVDEASYSAAQAVQVLRARDAGVSAAGQPQGTGILPAISRRDHLSGCEPLAFFAARGSGFVGVQGIDARGNLRTGGITADRRFSLCHNTGIVGLLLVFPGTQTSPPRSHRYADHTVRASADRGRILGPGL